MGSKASFFFYYADLTPFRCCSNTRVYRTPHAQSALGGWGMGDGSISKVSSIFVTISKKKKNVSNPKLI